MEPYKINITSWKFKVNEKNWIMKKNHLLVQKEAEWQESIEKRSGGTNKQHIYRIKTLIILDSH